ncbi:MAG: NUDIX domain-containing protein [bacterium]|nr:NUDIX domain-containing protein [bacterium]
MPHIHEKIDFTVEVFIVYDNKVLLRMHDKYKIWLSVGGHIELDEDPNEAALREVKEEVGLDIELFDSHTSGNNQDAGHRELIPPQFLNRHKISDLHEHISLIYFATTTTDRVTIPYANDRSDLWKWATREDLAAMDLKPAVRHYAISALDTLH